MDIRVMYELYQIAIEAGKEILDVYAQDFDVAVKEDDSPLTLADQRAHAVIAGRLGALQPSLPVLSEEGRDIAYVERKDWSRFWMVDPLDGTKEFVKRNGEFTVNIALIEGKYPVLGIIYAPVPDVFYFGKEGVGAFKLVEASRASLASVEALLEKSIRLPLVNDSTGTRVVASRSHMNAETASFIRELEADRGDVETLSSGSSLKFCLLAEGAADYYPRFAPTMEWDTAAGQAIVEAAGGTVVRHTDSQRFDYNKSNLLNGWFLAEGKL